jgi:hypothetical protein
MTVPVASTRRRFLHLLAAGGIVVALPSFSGCAGPANLTDEEFKARLLELVRHPRSAVSVGRIYLASAPAEAALPALLAALRGDLAQRRALSVSSLKRRRRALEQLCRADFAQGRVTSACGWVLALIEARLCALVALSESGGAPRAG